MSTLFTGFALTVQSICIVSYMVKVWIVAFPVVRRSADVRADAHM